MSQFGKAPKKSKTKARPEKLKLEFRLRDFQPMTKNQGRMLDHWFRGKNLFLHGYAGTGKTFMALATALQSVERGHHRRILIVRSAVPTRDMGFLPGNAKEKAQEYEGAYKTICAELYGRGDAYEILKQKNVLDFRTTSYVRGLTFDDTVVVVDEIQNLTFHEADSIITRVGENTKIIFSGDVTQSDFTRDGDKSGLRKFMKILEKIQAFEFIEFGIGDIVRSDLVRDYIIAKEYALSAPAATAS